MLRLGKTKQNDVTLLYVAKYTLKLLSIKQQKANHLYKWDQEISAISRINTNPGVVCLGFANGVIKDFDIKNR